MGLIASLIALAGVIYAVAVRIFTQSWVPGWAAIFVAVLFMGGVQLVAIDTIGEYVGRIYSESKMRPLYVVAEASAGIGSGLRRQSSSTPRASLFADD